MAERLNESVHVLKSLQILQTLNIHLKLAITATIVVVIIPTDEYVNFFTEYILKTFHPTVLLRLMSVNLSLIVELRQQDKR